MTTPLPAKYLAVAGALAFGALAVLLPPARPLLSLFVVVTGVLATVGSRRTAPDGPDALRRIRGWHVSDDVHLGATSIDRVVVTPSAVLAVTRHDGTEAEQRAAAESAAQRLREHLHSLPGSDPAVVPVLWQDGANAAHLVVDGVHLVDGNRVSAWTHVFREPRLAPATRLAVAADLDRHREPLASVASASPRPLPPAAPAAA